MTLRFKELPTIIHGEMASQADPEQPVDYLQTDSRRLSPTRGTIFLAIRGLRNDGHDYIEDLFAAGVNQFIVDREVALPKGTQANVIKVRDTVTALQQLAAYKRSLFDLQVVGITGSNGKTIVKEWLGQLMTPHKVVLKSPGSYNSQIGVPISVWNIAENHELAVFEAGISKTGEMHNLQAIIQPTIGIFTNIGTAHDEGFASREEKIAEKLKLFEAADYVIYCKDHRAIDKVIKRGFSWGFDANSDIVIESVKDSGDTTQVEIAYNQSSFQFTFPFVNNASFENAMHCVAFMLRQQFSHKEIQEGLDRLKTVKMRLELKRGINGCQLIDDTYNNDLGGLQVALDFAASQKQQVKKTVILSDLLQTGLEKKDLYTTIFRQLKEASIDKIIGIGPDITAYAGKDMTTYPSTEAFLSSHDLSTFDRELILIKGSRPFLFERIVRKLEEKIHGTHLEINLDALTHNLNFYKSKLNDRTKLMVMVKAFAYGSGSLEVANLLQHQRVDYLGVAYADEGATLRKNGITLPIMVMNPTEDSFEKLSTFNLEPEIYNLGILNKFIAFLAGNPASIHLKLDTGMHRLGFKTRELDTLIDLLTHNPNITIESIFSHLAGADEAGHNEYSHSQAATFTAMAEKIQSSLDIKPLRHLVNSPGIIRFPEYHLDMVRLGIGLYGIEATNNLQDSLEPISNLKTIISQINELKAGDTVGYSRQGRVDRPTKVATIAIGYADGYSRAFSNGKGHVFIHGTKVPVIGNVCMDMTMVDVTEVPNVKEGDTVEIFGRNLSIAEVAQYIDTIPYEVLTSISQRVKRIYFTE